MAGSARPYSVRFMDGRGSSRNETYTVPEGFRAVVTNFSLGWWGFSGEASFFVHGSALLYYTRPAQFTSLFEAVRFVGYERETFQMRTVGADMSYHLAGYLLADDYGRPDDADNTVTPTASTKPGSSADA